MGYMMGIGPCIGCTAIFSFNPNKVPSVEVDGKKEPICSACVKRANPMRIENGLPPIVPAPDAYEGEEVA